MGRIKTVVKEVAVPLENETDHSVNLIDPHTKFPVALRGASTWFQVQLSDFHRTGKSYLKRTSTTHRLSLIIGTSTGKKAELGSGQPVRMSLLQRRFKKLGIRINMVI